MSVGKFYYFEERSMPEPNSGCWIWLFAVNKTDGYGRAKINRKVTNAHRACLEVKLGRSITGMDACHKCDTPTCVNPDHLFEGSRFDNMNDCITKGRFKNVVGLKGQHHHSSKLEPQHVYEIRASTKSIHQLSRDFGVDRSSIRAIINRKSWKHLS